MSVLRSQIITVPVSIINYSWIELFECFITSSFPRLFVIFLYSRYFCSMSASLPVIITEITVLANSTSVVGTVSVGAFVSKFDSATLMVTIFAHTFSIKRLINVRTCCNYFTVFRYYLTIGPTLSLITSSPSNSQA